METSRPQFLFVFGAGASADAGMPLYRDLLRPEFFDGILVHLDGLRVDSEFMSADLHRDLGEMFGGLPIMRGSELLDLLAGQVVNAREACVSFPSDMAFEDLLEHLWTSDQGEADRLLAYYIRMLHVVDNAFQSVRLPTYIIYDFMATLRVLLDEFSVGILSFNHDLLYEMSAEILRNRFAATWAPRFSYYLPHQTTTTLSEALKRPILVGGIDPEQVYAHLATDHVPLLKLHGSFNWLLCPTCGKIVVTGDDPNVLEWETEDAWLRSGGAHEDIHCSGTFRPAVVPPKRAKDMSGLRQVWAHATDLVRNASHICFVGYSMPAYDHDAVRLFSKCAAGRGVSVIAKGLDGPARRRWRETLGGDIKFVDGTFAEVLRERPQSVI